MNHQTRVYESVFETMPSEEYPTPVVRINRLNPAADFLLYAKLEWMNPFGSVKDRAAWALLRELEERGEIGNGRGIVEPTSGNTGISLAAMARARGYHMRAVVPNKIPLEKKVLLKIAGADLDVISDELCPAPGLGEGSINLGGRYQTDLRALEAEVKDSTRYPDKWAYFDFGPTKDEAVPFPKEARCFSCHQQNGAVDNTFVQFYPTLGAR